MDEAIKLRCHMLSDVVGYPKEKSKREHLTQTAKSALLKLARENLLVIRILRVINILAKGMN